MTSEYPKCFRNGFIKIGDLNIINVKYIQHIKQERLMDGEYYLKMKMSGEIYLTIEDSYEKLQEIMKAIITYSEPDCVK